LRTASSSGGSSDAARCVPKLDRTWSDVESRSVSVPVVRRGSVQLDRARAGRRDHKGHDGKIGHNRIYKSRAVVRARSQRAAQRRTFFCCLGIHGCSALVTCRHFICSVAPILALLRYCPRPLHPCQAQTEDAMGRPVAAAPAPTSGPHGGTAPDYKHEMARPPTRTISPQAHPSFIGVSGEAASVSPRAGVEKEVGRTRADPQRPTDVGSGFGPRLGSRIWSARSAGDPVEQPHAALRLDNRHDQPGTADAEL
jgi:hypothetical protein